MDMPYLAAKLCVNVLIGYNSIRLVLHVIDAERVVSDGD